MTNVELIYRLCNTLEPLGCSFAILPDDVQDLYATIERRWSLPGDDELRKVCESIEHGVRRPHTGIDVCNSKAMLYEVVECVALAAGRVMA